MYRVILVNCVLVSLFNPRVFLGLVGSQLELCYTSCVLLAIHCAAVHIVAVNLLVS
jgi:hypothetical protein